MGVLAQMLALLKVRVFAVVRKRTGVEILKRRLEELGCTKAFIDDDTLRTRIEELGVSLPQLAFDGVGGDATARLVSALGKTGDIVCYGHAAGQRQQVFTTKKWKGAFHHFSLDEWIHADLDGGSSAKLSNALEQVSKFLQRSKLILDIREFQASTPGEFLEAVSLAREPARLHSVVIHFPTLPGVETIEGCCSKTSENECSDDSGEKCESDRKEEQGNDEAEFCVSMEEEKECSSSAPTTFNGLWQKESGEEMATIFGDHIFWADGPPMRLRADGEDYFSVEMDSETFRARLSDGCLLWSDGDVWLRDGTDENKKAS